MTEIRNQPLLRAFGSFLAFTHLLTAYFWLDLYWGHIGHFTDPFPLCWPHLQGCESWGRMTANQLFVVMGIYSAIAAVAGALFYFVKRTRTAVFLLALASLMKFALFQLDFRLSGNYHYMHFWVLTAYFLVSQKSLTIRFLILGFYFGAGLLKLNREWLTGSAIWENPYFSGDLLQAGCIYVVILELFLIFGLLNRRRWVFWITIAQLFLFHIVSYFIVYYYYPLMQLSLLSLFVMAELRSPGDFKWAQLKELRWPSLALLILFSLAQTVPFILGGDRAIDTRGRLVALSMFDALVQCKSTIMAKFENPNGGLIERTQPRIYRLELRLNCDPHVLLTEAAYRCLQYRENPSFRSLDVALKSKRKSDADFRQVFSFEDLCNQPRRVNFWGLIR
jgi:hypothetical protein